jgi:hypothetical protein
MQRRRSLKNASTPFRTGQPRSVRDRLWRALSSKMRVTISTGGAWFAVAVDDSSPHGTRTRSRPSW